MNITISTDQKANFDNRPVQYNMTTVVHGITQHFGCVRKAGLAKMWRHNLKTHGRIARDYQTAQIRRSQLLKKNGSGYHYPTDHRMS